MICTTCREPSFVLRTTKTARVEIRERGCDCGDRWETTERETGGTRHRYTAAISSSPVAVPAQPGSDSPSVSDLNSQGLSLVPSKPQSQTPARVRKSTRIDYPEEFEAEWRQTSKTGSKDKALDFWLANGRKAFGASWKRWEESHEWRQSWHNDPHVVSWLNDGRWKQEPPERRAQSHLPEKVEQSRATVVAWTQKGQP